MNAHRDDPKPATTVDEARERIAALEQAVRLLRDAGQSRWAGRLDRDRSLIEGRDFYGVEHLLQAFGGMGSFNDVVLPSPAENAELQRLSSRIYEIADT